MQASAVQQRRRSAEKRLVEPQVVQGAVVSRLLVAVEIRRIGNELHRAQVAFDLQCRQVELVRVIALRRIRVDVVIVAGIGIDGPVVLDVVTVPVLVIDARCYGPILGRRPDRRESHERRRVVVRVALVDRLRGRVDPVDPAAVAAIPDAGPDAERAIDDRSATGDSGLVTRRTALRIGCFGTTVHARLRQARLIGDEAHRAAFGACAEQRALRAAQHLDAIDVE